MDLIRDLLMYFEARPSSSVLDPGKIEIEGHDESSIAYHVTLMCEAGLLSCELIRSTTTEDRVVKGLPFRLTWEGHEFLDAARNDSTWERAKSKFAEHGLSASFTLLRTVLVGIAKQQLNLPS